LIVIILGGATYLVFFSKLLDIKRVEVTGYSHPEVIEEIAKDQMEKSFFSSNVLFFSTSNLTSTLSGEPKIKKVRVRKILPQKIIISIDEAKGSIIWSSVGDKFLISEGGVVMEPAREENLPIVFDAANIKVTPGEKVASPTFINFINTINEKFQPVTGEEIQKIIIFDILSDVHVLAKSGWTVYFNSNKDPETQLKNLARILEEARKGGQTKLQYIDMRIEDRIFYK
jgi:cell division septal protein FtsQ